MSARGPADDPVRSVRFTFAFDDDGLRLAGRTPRRKAALRGLDTLAPPPGLGVTLEVQAASGEVLHRQVLARALPQSVEVPRAGGGLRRMAMAPRRGVVTAVVPNLEGAASVVVHAGGGATIAQPAFVARGLREGGRRELARVPFGGR